MPPKSALSSEKRTNHSFLFLAWSVGLISKKVERKEDAMKTRWLTTAALGLLLVWPAVAQNSWTTKATTSVPFDFVVKGTTLPAGDYRIMTYGAGNSLLIQNIDDPDQAVVMHNRNIMLNPDGAILEDTKLVFVLSDGQHVLHQIGVADDNHIHDIVHGANVVELVATR